MKSYDITISGFGGQGILFLGKVLAYVGMAAAKEVSWYPSYGPEMRGGTAGCSVRISSKAIGSPLVTEPNVLILMNAPSYDKHIPTARPGALVFLDASLIFREHTRDDIRVFQLPATQLSIDANIEGLANIILLGRLIKETQLATVEEAVQAIEKSVSSKKEDILQANKKALELGFVN